MAITATSGNPHSSWDFAVPLDPDDLPSSLQQYASNGAEFDFENQPVSRQRKPPQATRKTKTAQLSAPTAVTYASPAAYSSPASRSRSGSLQSNHMNDTLTSTTSSASSRLQEYNRVDSLTTAGHHLTNGDDEYSDNEDQGYWVGHVPHAEDIEDEEDQHDNALPSYDRPGNTAGSVPGVTNTTPTTTAALAQGKRPRPRDHSNNGDKTLLGKGVTRDQQQYWINRDKLARIESFELQQAGIRVPRQIVSPSMPPRFHGSRGRDSRSTSAQSHGHNQTRNASRSRSYTRNGSRSRTSSKHRYRTDEHDAAAASSIPVPPELQSFSSPQGDYSFSVPQVAEPSATDKDSGLGEDAAPPPLPPHSHPGYDRANGTSTPTRKATSKIPIPSSIGGAAAGSSRLPVPMTSSADGDVNAVPSDRPNSRERANTTCSTATSESGRGRGRNGASSPVQTLMWDDGRPRSNSSGNLLQQATGQSDSPARSRPSGPGATKQTSSQAPSERRTRRTSVPLSSRKNSGPTHGVQKATRNTSSNNSSATNTPTSSRAGKTAAGSANSSTHHHSPSGEPPWMLNAFRPDPRLPPEKQILPTHARKLLQEQWEKEGKTGLVYDRDFSPLAIVDSNEVQRAVQRAMETREKEQEERLIREQENEQRSREQESEQQAEQEHKEKENNNDKGNEKDHEARADTIKHDVSEETATGKSPGLLSPDTPASPTESDLAPPAPAARASGERRSVSRYRTIPPVQPTPTPPAPQIETKITRTPTPEQVQNQEEKKEKGCGCCIVM